MKNDRQLIEKLEQIHTTAPDGFASRVMAALPQPKGKTGLDWWPSHGRWLAPAFAGALATLLVVFGAGRLMPSHPSVADAQVTFHFELHAPGAERVELLGTFNNWQTGDIVLCGPDASGHWTTDIALPEGRHEYIFLVDGRQWVADPKAATHRSDGFGRVNAVIKVYDNDNT